METSFLQGRAWEEFQRAAGYRVFRLQDILMIEHLSFGRAWLYLPRVTKIQQPIIFCRALERLASKHRVDWVKIEFRQQEEFINFKRLAKRHYSLQPSWTLQPRETLLLDLSADRAVLLAQMKAKTRYNIRLSRRRGVEVVEDKTTDRFWQLAELTARRNGFYYHPKRYYQTMLKSLAPQLKVFTAEKNRQPLASALVLFWRSTAYYLHGASDWRQRELMAPFGLHWEIIQQAKKNGQRWYDFWGVALQPKNSSYERRLAPDDQHSWAGITRFKLGFAPNGQVIDYPPALDLIFRPGWYKIYSLARKTKLNRYVRWSKSLVKTKNPR